MRVHTAVRNSNSVFCHSHARQRFQSSFHTTKHKRPTSNDERQRGLTLIYSGICKWAIFFGPLLLILSVSPEFSRRFWPSCIKSVLRAEDRYQSTFCKPSSPSVPITLPAQAQHYSNIQEAFFNFIPHLVDSVIIYKTKTHYQYFL
jgi:hypothetical protein